MFHMSTTSAVSSINPRVFWHNHVMDGHIWKPRNWRRRLFFIEEVERSLASLDLNLKSFGAEHYLSVAPIVSPGVIDEFDLEFYACHRWFGYAVALKAMGEENNL